MSDCIVLSEKQLSDLLYETVKACGGTHRTLSPNDAVAIAAKVTRSPYEQQIHRVLIDTFNEVRFR